MTTILLKKGREHSLLRRHPWVFSGAVLGLRGPDPAPGETVDVIDADGRWLARGAFSPDSSILVRAWTFDEAEPIDADFFRRRVAAAVALRAGRFDPASGRTALRLVHGESDGLPGVVADRYGDVVVLQLNTAGADRWRGEIADALAAAVPEAISLYERSDAPARALEGLTPCDGLLRGPEPPDTLEVRWAGLAFGVPLRTGHKTGTYLDQADNLPLVGPLAAGADVLDAFCYTGGFTMAALRAGARSVVSLDSSAPALDALRANLARNDLDATRVETLCDDAFRRLRTFRDQGRSFDLIVLDPPKFAESRSQVERACRAYKDVNLLAFKLLRHGGRLATFSCSGSVSPELFQKVVADAALDARRFARVVGRFQQAPDHPVALSFPEGGYLKGLLCAVE